jgi:hypothetical protein
MTPSFIGRIAVMFPGVRPSICFAASPTALNGFLAVGSAFLADRHHGRLVEHDAFSADVYQCVGRAEVDREIGGEVLGNEGEHLDP